MAEFEDGTWCPGISEVIKVVGIIAESGMGVTGCNRKEDSSRDCFPTPLLKGIF